jgi:hypothetical protein
MPRGKVTRIDDGTWLGMRIDCQPRGTSARDANGRSWPTAQADIRAALPLSRSRTSNPVRKMLMRD